MACLLAHNIIRTAGAPVLFLSTCKATILWQQQSEQICEWVMFIRGQIKP